MLKKRILVLMFVVAFLLLVGCGPSNHAPILTSSPITTATVGVEYTYDVNATDPDGDTLTYSLATPGGMTINPATGLIKWTPVTAQIGDNPVTVKVSDGTLSITQSFKIKVGTLPPVNHAPTINSIPVTIATVGVNYFYDVNATDPDGDTLTYSLATPAGMTINSATGVISWIPTLAQVGNNLVTVKVSDGALSDTQSFTITVSAVEPEPEIELTGIVVDPKTMDLFVGGSEEIVSVTATYEIRGTEVPIALGECTYESDDEGVATVTDTGVVTAVAEGVATITVSFREEITKTVYIEKIDTVEVTVIKLKWIRVSPERMVFGTGGSSLSIISITATCSDGFKADLTLEIALDACDYSSNDPAIVTADAGVVTSVNPGRATITVSFTGGSTTCTDTVEVYDNIQDASDDGNHGDTILVAEGIYEEDVVINAGLTLLGTGYGSTTIIQGQDGGETGALHIASSDVTVDGFIIKGKQKTVRITVGTSNVTFTNNKVETGNNANEVNAWSGFETHSGTEQSDLVIDGNIFEANYTAQLVYINPNATNVQFTNNTLQGTMRLNTDPINSGLVVGFEGLDGNQDISGNTFDITSAYGLLEVWGNYDMDDLLDDNSWPQGGEIVGNKVVTP